MTDYDSGAPDSDAQTAITFGFRNPSESVHLCRGFAFCNNGKVRLPDGEQADLWQECLDGRPVKHLVEGFLSESSLIGPMSVVYADSRGVVSGG